MNRGPNSPVMAFSPSSMRIHAAFLGGGAGTNGTVCSNGQSIDTTGLFPKAVNFGSSLTYNSSTGLYYATLTEYAKHILNAYGTVTSGGNSPTTALYCLVSKIIPTTKIIHVRIYTPAGTLTDLETSDRLVLTIDCADTTAIG